METRSSVDFLNEFSSRYIYFFVVHLELGIGYVFQLIFIVIFFLFLLLFFSPSGAWNCVIFVVNSPLFLLLFLVYLELRIEARAWMVFILNFLFLLLCKIHKDWHERIIISRVWVRVNFEMIFHLILDDFRSAIIPLSASFL